MGKASRRKHQQRLQKSTQQKYGGVKLPDAIDHLCKPYDDDLGFEGFRNLVGLAVTAWNIALATDVDTRVQKMQDALAKALPDDRLYWAQEASNVLSAPDIGHAEPPDSVIMTTILADLVHRKDELYPNDERVIVDFELNHTARGYHLKIKSLIPKRVDN